ncbi:flavin reductase family protein [Nocardia asiatica]|uniref:flavin reductase family protein n=1 Tax=Nocardia TaxID=1817 RepID=UPI002455B1D8|nr:flavin reductase family protein [Nocardia carnea]
MSGFTAEKFREVLGHFPTGITVITGSSAGKPFGFTCQSFSALSLDPPLVVVLPSRKSVSWPQIAESGSFCVNVLSEGQRDVSARFGQSGSDKFAEIDWHPSPLGLPVLAGSCTWMDCSIERTYPGGDHLIIVGRVQHLGASSESVSPLIFHRGRYATGRPLLVENRSRSTPRIRSLQYQSGSGPS